MAAHTKVDVLPQPAEPATAPPVNKDVNTMDTPASSAASSRTVGRPDAELPATRATDPATGEEGAANNGAEAQVEAQAQEDGRPQRSKLKIALIMLSLGIAVLLVALDITIVTTALPTIAEQFHSAAGYTWVGSAYLIANSAATPIWGKVSDIFGRKPILLVTNAIFFVGSLLAAVSVNMDMLIAARVIQGIGGGGLIVLVNICISDLFAMRERGAYFGIIGGVWALASSLGPIVGGALTQRVSLK